MTPQQLQAMKMALAALKNNKLTHLYCEDTWYSCPKHEDGCANEADGDECNCGADDVNAQFDQAITALEEALAQPEQEPLFKKIIDKHPGLAEELKALDEQELVDWRNAAIRVGEDLSSVGPDGYYDMTAQEWLDWAIEQEPRGKNSLTQPEQEPVIDKSAAKRIATTLGWEPKRGWVGAGDLENSNAYLTPPQRKPDYKEFMEWASSKGYDTAYTVNSDTGEFIALNPQTADLWKAWQAAHGIKENT